MTTNTKKGLIAAALIVLGICIGAGGAYAMKKMQDFDRMMDAREASPDKEKFDRDFQAMADWFETYKQEHPGATDEDAQRAFDDLWKKQ